VTLRSTVTQYLWLAKSDSLTSNDCRFTYMLDFILKPEGKLGYQENASLLSLKKKIRVSTPTENRVKDLTRSKERLPTTRASNFARVSENGVNVCKQISSLYCFTTGSLTRVYPCKRPALVTAVLSNSRGDHLGEL